MYRSRPGSGFKAPRFVNERQNSPIEASAKAENTAKSTPKIILNKSYKGSQIESTENELDSLPLGNEIDAIHKRRRLLVLQSKRAIAAPLHRPASSNSQNSADAVDSTTHSQGQDPASTSSTRDKYLVQWRKKSTKKNKTWEGDGSLVTVTHSDGSIYLEFKDNDGKLQSKKSVPNSKRLLDSIISIGQYELEIDTKVSSTTSLTQETSLQPPVNINILPETQFKKMIPKQLHQAGGIPVVVKEPSPLCDIPNAFTLPRPKSATSDIIDVHIDPVLASKLRPHQVEGISFMYECIMGMRNFKGRGCLLADEMGLGKTLMTISVIWTLLKQNPFKAQPKPILRKVLIVCPVTLINNWKNEFKKWLGTNNVSVLTLNGNSPGTSNIKDQQNIINFGRLHVYNVLILNYEKVSTYSKELNAIDFDLLVCDEGHRLKSSTNKVLAHLVSFNIPRKIMLTGTPIQNDLIEFYTIINFLNPGVLGDFKSFQKTYMVPILKSRDVNCFDENIKKTGEMVSNSLIGITKKFVLRRTQSILLKYLTSKTDVLLFAPPTKLQLKLFSQILSLKAVSELMQDLSSSNHVFALINLFKKLCGSPSLLSDDDYYQKLLKGSKELTQIQLPTASGKIQVLIPLLLEIVSLNEKVVLVSNYTKTLDMLETVLQRLNLSFLRLDGSTSKNMRNKLVDDFNRADCKRVTVFLLSSKSGGMGINLIGASRLVLFDNDWNPAADLQSMSRIHRDGQRKDCFIYRIFTTGCIDEKIFQRQLMKTNLSMKFLDNNAKFKTDDFDYNDLKNLFEINFDTNSNTHDLLGCDCLGDGANLEVVASVLEPDSDTDTDEDELSSNLSKQNSWMSATDFKQKLDNNEIKMSNGAIRLALNDYKHIQPLQGAEYVSDNIQDQVLLNIINNRSYSGPGKLPISYIMTKTSEKNDNSDYLDVIDAQ